MSEKEDLPERISARVSTKVRARLEELAAADDRPVGAIIRRIVTRAVERGGGDDGGGLAA
jgi:predicted transcriptional regulator